MLQVAFKEWAAVCLALARGQQTVLLRKGGIAEIGGEFQPEHSRFWLYPTYYHEQQQAGLKAEWQSLLTDAEVARPEAGQLCLTHWAEVRKVQFLTDLNEVLSRQAEHVWNEVTVRQRFAYRQPGLYFLDVVVHTALEPLRLPEKPEYAGCKTWVQLG